MGGAEPCPTKFSCGAALQQSSNLFYQKFLKIDSVGGYGKEKGFKGKGNRRSRLRFSPNTNYMSLALRKIAPLKFEKG